MHKTLELSNGTIISIESNPFASGGEGDLFKVKEPAKYAGKVVKVYKRDKRTRERENKVIYLSANPPQLISKSGHQPLVWVEDVAFEQGKFCGVLMPLANGIKLELLCHVKLPLTVPQEFKKFDFQNKNAIELRLKLCYNIAAAIFQIHRHNRYALIDMKPENIIIQHDGLISIIDTDSIAVLENNRLLYAAPVATPEYTPPEQYNSSISNNNHNEYWDRFSMAVIFYRLLCGIHPYAGSCLGQYERCHGHADMIQNGLFPNGSKSKFFKVIPPPHNNFNKLPPEIQKLFLHCFDEGHNNPCVRPDANEWCKYLRPENEHSLSRPRPSTVFPFPSIKYTSPLTFPNLTTPTIATINYMSIKKPIALRRLFIKLIRGEKRLHLIESISQLEENIRIKEKTARIKIDNLIKISNKFNQTQNDLLIKEKSKIEHLKSQYQDRMRGFDKQSLENHIFEKSEIKAHSSSLEKDLQDLIQQIKTIHNNIFGKKFDDHEIKISAIKREVRKLETEQTNELIKELKNPLKLSHINIQHSYQSRYLRLSVAQKKALFDVGIVTASDVVQVNDKGHILCRNGKWVKVNGIGGSRANVLIQWIKYLEDQENREIEKKVKESYYKKFAILKLTLNNTESKFKEEVLPLQLLFDKEISSLNKRKFIIEDAIQKKLKEIHEKYNNLQNGILCNAQAFIDASIIPELNAIPGVTHSDLKQNQDLHIELYKNVLKELMTVMDELRMDVNSLTSLHIMYRK